MIPLCLPLVLLPTKHTSDAPTCLVLDLDVAGRLEQSWPDDGVSTALTLPRSRLELGLTSGQHRARVAAIAARTGGLGSSTGVSGEAIVPVLQIAEAAWIGPNLTIAAGLIDDPWVVLGNDDWGLRAAAPSLGESVGWMDRSDLGISAAWGAPDSFVSAIATFTSGEGANFAERNNGKNTTAMLIARPVPDRPELLTVSLMGRDGSRGLDSARDHRAGGRITAALPPVRLGGEVLTAWGVGGDIERTPVGLSTWAEGTLPLSLTVFARFDQTTEDVDESTTRILRGGVTWGAEPVDVILGVEHTDADDQAVTVAGAGAFEEQTTLYVLLHVRQGGSVVLTP
ncbi:MAG: hypothetical protein ACI8RZ_002901 [Myxococcota bacterium]|jgi:hypothetical protein